MQCSEAAPILADIFAHKLPIYVYTEPEVLDFTSHDGGKLVISGKRRVELDIDTNEIKIVMGMLGLSLFDKDITSSLIAWNLKSLLSYAKRFAGIPTSTTPIFDLQIIENFLGVSQPKPNSLPEAVNRLKATFQYKSWRSLYYKLHLPLATDVLPAIETFPLLNSSTRDICYAHYDIEGQQNGRLRCAKRFEKGYLAHTMGADQKAVLKPKGYNLSFLVADISNCEVTVLQWLSSDKKLKDIIDSGKDLYREIYQIITKDKCDTSNKRKIAQIMFLSVIYGSMAKGLAASLKVSEKIAEELRDRIQQSFPTCMGWLQEQQEEAKKGPAIDYFGRPRSFENKPYLARNFVVQGVAATVCLEKLVALKRILKYSNICFTVHDGYGIIVPNDRIEETAKTVKNVLEEPSSLCPGLKMRAKIEVGPTLDEMKVYQFEE